MTLPDAMLRTLRFAGDHPWQDRIEPVWDQLSGEQPVVLLPRVAGADAMLVRWLYRHQLAAGTRGWWRLVQVGGSADPTRLRRALALAMGGWLWVEQAIAPEIARHVAGMGGRLLVPEGPSWTPPKALIEAWMVEERLHIVATDRAFDEVRAAARRAWRGGGAVCALGPSGSGRASLLQWTHLVEGRGEDLVELSPDRTNHQDLSEVPLLRMLEDWPVATARRVVHALSAAPSRPRSTQVDAPPRPTHPAFTPILGDSPRLRRALAAAALAATGDGAVHLSGESGTGKEGFAAAIHAASARASGPYIAVNAATLHPQRAEADLFGWRKGAFTDAHRDSPGLFGEADGGTLFLDEIADLPPEVQPRLLRVLEDGSLTRLGDTRERRINVRLITASHRPLETLREDLYFRLKSTVISLPTLAERVSDIALLAAHFLGVASKAEVGLGPGVQEALEALPWPGNVRELKKAMEALAPHLGPDRVARLEHLTLAHLRTPATAPLLVTTAVAPAALPWLHDAQRVALQRGIARMPALDELGPPDLQEILRGLLGDRAIEDAALARLAEMPWPGGLAELVWRVDALVSAPEQNIGLATLGRVHPDLFPEERGEDLWVRDAAGPTRRVANGALLVAGHGLITLVASDPARLAPLLSAPDGLGGRLPERWPLARDGAAVLIFRVGSGVRVLRIAGGEAGAPWVRFLEEGTSARVLTVGELVQGSGGVVVEGLPGLPVLAAFTAKTPCEGWTPPTEPAGPEGAALDTAPAERRFVEPHAPLRPDERRALIALLVAHAAGDDELVTHLRRRCLEHGEAGRSLLTRLESDRGKSQMIERFFLARNKNAGLLEELAAAMHANPEARRTRLPAALLRDLERLDTR